MEKILEETEKARLMALIFIQQLEAVFVNNDWVHHASMSYGQYDFEYTAFCRDRVSVVLVLKLLKTFKRGRNNETDRIYLQKLSEHCYTASYKIQI